MEHAMKSALPYRREVYRLWFEYLKLARASSDPLVKAALKTSAAFYAPWGDVTKFKFDAWWKTHGHLFEEKYSVRRVPHGNAPSDPNALLIEVPLTQSPTALTKRVRVIIQEAFAEQGRARKKAKKRPSSSYRPTEGAEPKLVAVREMLMVYRNVYRKNPKLRGMKLLDAVHAYYKGRKDKRWAKVPFALMTGGYEGDARPLRNLRRYIQNAEKVMLNVARGEFPGGYWGSSPQLALQYFPR
jgi:hypothetical protein